MSMRVQFLPSGAEISVQHGETLLDAAVRSGLAPSHCCASGCCGRCKARVLAGQPGRRRYHDYVFTAAEKSAGMVLLCCTGADSDLLVEAVLGGDQDNAATAAITDWNRPLRRARRTR